MRLLSNPPEGLPGISDGSESPSHRSPYDQILPFPLQDDLFMIQLGDVEDLTLRTTIHLGDPQTTANFIEVLQRAISDDHTPWTSSHAFKRLRSSPSGKPAFSFY
jgi:hypothetical protein